MSYVIVFENAKDFGKSNVQEAILISSYFVLVEDIIWFMVEHGVMILGFYRVRLENTIPQNDPDENF